MKRRVVILMVLLLAFGNAGGCKKGETVQEAYVIQMYFDEEIDVEQCKTIIEEKGGKIVSEENSIGMYNVEFSLGSEKEAEKLSAEFADMEEISEAFLLETDIPVEVQEKK